MPLEMYLESEIKMANFPTAKELINMSNNVSKNDGNEALYNEYLEDLKELLTNMALTKNREISITYGYLANSGYGELALISKRGYLDANYTDKVFKMLDDNGYYYYQYAPDSIFSRKGLCKIWIE